MDSIHPMNFDERPAVVAWEVSRACDLACLHCRATTQPKRSTLELSTFEGYDLIEQVAEMNPGLFAFTGGDPLKRADFFELADFASRRGLASSVYTSATPLLTTDSIMRMKDAGISRMSIALDGPSADIHDGVRGTPGAFRETVDSIDSARAVGLPVEISTIVSRFNVNQIGEMVLFLREIDIVTWNLHFYVPSGRGQVEDMVSAEEMERVFCVLYETARTVPFEIRTTEAMHYRRYVLQRELMENPELAREVHEHGLNYSTLVSSTNGNGGRATDSCGRRLPQPLDAVSDGKGYLFVSHIGEVYPSDFLPLSGGNIRFRKLSHIYQSSPLFTILRNSAELGGKCGLCEFKEICGGSRARAYAVAGDPMAEEPLCAYQPAVMRENVATEH